MEAWSGKHISLAGRATLIQAVLSALPTYCFSFYKLPKKVIKEITRMQHEFLWHGGCANGGAIPWVAWADVCWNKSEGGLGIKDLGVYNRALLGKWIAHILCNPDCLWTRVLRSKYGGIDVGFDARKGGSGMSAWWLDLKEMFRGVNGDGLATEFEKMIGNGDNTGFWDETWIGDVPLRIEFPRLYRLSTQKLTKVSNIGKWENN